MAEELPRLGDKQPSEKYWIEFDFTEYLNGATVSTATITVVDLADDSTVTSTLTDSTKQRTSTDGQKVLVYVRAGTADHEYQITCLATASDASVYELDCILPVTEY